MFPELFTIPFTNGLTVKGYGLMMVIGFLAAVHVIRRLSRDITPEPQMITNAALYALIAGVVGARIFYVVHYYEKFADRPLSVFAIWQGGLELLGGVILAILVIFLYLRYHKLPTRKYLDILAIGLLMALIFGRLGCFLNGCCFGKPTNLPWGVCFPYGSPAYLSQIYNNEARNRPAPYLRLPPEFSTAPENKNGIAALDLKPKNQLSAEQIWQVEKGPYRCLPVHPTQLYASAYAAICAAALYLFWRRGQKVANVGKKFVKPGCTFALMFIMYGIGRFSFEEFLRDDNPLNRITGLTISQNLSLFVLIPLGIGLLFVFEKVKFDKVAGHKGGK